MSNWFSFGAFSGGAAADVQMPHVHDDERSQSNGAFHWQAGEVGSHTPSESVDGGPAPSVAMSAHADQVNIDRLTAKLTNLQGIDFNDELRKIMGQGVTPKCMVDRGTGNDDWQDFRDKANEDEGISYVRALVVNVPLDCFSPDAKSARDFRTPLDPAFQARTAAIAQLLSMFFIGTSKGHYTGNDAQIAQLVMNGIEGEELEKAKKERVPIAAYLWRPCQRSDGSYTNSEFLCTQFNFAVEALYDEDETQIVGVRFWKWIFDKLHSDSELWRTQYRENDIEARSGSATGVSNKGRDSVGREAHKTQRWMADPSRLEETAPTQYKRIRNVSDIFYMFSAIGGGAQEGDPNRRAHVLPDMNATAPPGSSSHEYSRHEVFGGFHPYCPEFLLNALRPDGLPLAAGLLDANGVRIKVSKSQLDPRSYRPDGCMCHHLPPVCHRHNAFHVLVNPHRTNPFERDLPFELHGQLRPGEHLLELYWDLYKDSDPLLLAARRSAAEESAAAMDVAEDEDAEEEEEEEEEEEGEEGEAGSKETEGGLSYKDFSAELITCLSGLTDEVNSSSLKLAKSIMDSFSVSQDTLDLNSEEKRQIKKGNMHFSKVGEDVEMEPRQAIKVMSQSMGRIFDFIKEWRAQKDNEIAEERRLASEKREADMVAAKKVKEKMKRQHMINKVKETDYESFSDAMEEDVAERHCKCMRDLISLSLLHFRSNFTSRRQRDDIPPGWRDAWDQFDIILHDVQKLAEPGFKVDPNHPNASVGTASLGYLFNHDMLSTKVSPFGAWRKMLVDTMSRTACVSGREVRIMLNGWLHTFEAFMPVSYLYVVCGGAGNGKSMRPERLQKMMPEGWIMKTGGGSEKAGQNGKWDKLCGRTAYYDEVPAEMKTGIDGARLEYLKQMLSDNEVQNTRTVKVIGANGLESMQTIRLFTYHFEAHWISTNLGPALINGNDEPSGSRTPFLDRAYVECVFNSTGGEQVASTTDFEQTLQKDAKLVATLKLVSCLMMRVLVFLKDQPFLKPDMSFANRIFVELDNMLVNEFNLPKLKPRKQGKRDMTLLTLTVEEAIVQKFVFKITSDAFPDMRPDADGNLPPFDILQLESIVRMLSPSREVILEAWSRSLDYATATSAHAFHAMSVIASAHGVEMDFKRMVNDESMMQAQQIPGTNDPNDPANTRLVGSGFRMLKGVPEGGITFKEVRTRAEQHEFKRLTVLEYMRRCKATSTSVRKDEVMGTDLLPGLIKRLGGEDKTLQIRGVTLTAQQAAGVILPDAQDMLGAGYTENVISAFLSGRFAAANRDFTCSRHATGERGSKWRFHKDNESSADKEKAADFNVSWRTIPTSQPVAIERRWNSAAAEIISASMHSNKDGRVAIEAFGMTKEIIRDLCFLLQEPDSQRLVTELDPKHVASSHRADDALEVPNGTFPTVESMSGNDLAAEGRIDQARGTDPPLRAVDAFRFHEKSNEVVSDNVEWADHFLKDREPLPDNTCTDKDATMIPESSVLQQRLDYLVRRHRFASASSLLGASVANKTVLRMSNDNKLIVNGHHLVAHARFAVECALGNAEIEGYMENIETLSSSSMSQHVCPNGFAAPPDASGQDAIGVQVIDETSRDASAAGSHGRQSRYFVSSVGESERDVRLSPGNSRLNDALEQPSASDEEPDAEVLPDAATSGAADAEEEGYAEAAPLPCQNPEKPIVVLSAPVRKLAVNNQRLTRLPYTYDMHLVYLTKRANDRFYCDAELQIESVASIAPPGTFLGNPQTGYGVDCTKSMINMTTRFPTVQDKPVKCLTLPMGQKDDAMVTEVSVIIKPSAEDIEKVRVHESEVRARVLDISDPIVQDAVSQMFDQGLKCCHGDLYAWTTWKMHQLNSLRSRGMMHKKADPVGHEIIVDTGIFLATRLKFAKALTGMDDFDKAPFKPKRVIEGMENVGQTEDFASQLQRAPDRYVNQRIAQQVRNKKQLMKAMKEDANSQSSRVYVAGKGAERSVRQRLDPAQPIAVRAESSSALCVDDE